MGGRRPAEERALQHRRHGRLRLVVATASAEAARRGLARHSLSAGTSLLAGLFAQPQACMIHFFRIQSSGKNIIINRLRHPPIPNNSGQPPSTSITNNIGQALIFSQTYLLRLATASLVLTLTVGGQASAVARSPRRRASWVTY